MFCDLVGSTQLATQLDPEDLQQVIGEYHPTVAAAVAPYEGHVAQLLGDGVLVYFGYPLAHEDDALRALRAGLAVLDAIARPGAPGRPALRTRIGIATGLVVVGDIGSGTPAAERSASGETPNLAARLQSVAQPGEIVVSDETRRLVGSAFDLEPLPGLELKGFAAAVRAWRVVGERAVATRFEAQHTHALTQLVGRDSELALLVERWAMACDGEGQVVLLSGEAGIGKSRISQALRERVSARAVHGTGLAMLAACAEHRAASGRAATRARGAVRGRRRCAAAARPSSRRRSRPRAWGPKGSGACRSCSACPTAAACPQANRRSRRRRPRWTR